MVFGVTVFLTRPTTPKSWVKNPVNPVSSKTQKPQDPKTFWRPHTLRHWGRRLPLSSKSLRLESSKPTNRHNQWKKKLEFQNPPEVTTREAPPWHGGFGLEGFWRFSGFFILDPKVLRFFSVIQRPPKITKRETTARPQGFWDPRVLVFWSVLRFLEWLDSWPKGFFRFGDDPEASWGNNKGGDGPRPQGFGWFWVFWVLLRLLDYWLMF